MITTQLTGVANYSLYQKLNKAFSSPFITGIVVSTAIISRIIQLVFFYNIRVDASYQVLATEHLVNGHGVSLAYINPANLSEIIYKPLNNWPPGYSLLLLPFYLLSGKNYIASGIALDVIMGVMLILTCRAILRHLSCSVAMQNICTIINGFFVYYFYFIASSDAIAISFFSLVILFTIKLLQRNGNDNKSLFFIILISFIVSLVKYLFIPVSFVVPIYLFVSGYLSKQKNIRKAGLISFAILFLFNASFLLYQISTTAKAAYISAAGRGLFPEHLIDIYPFVPASFIKPDTLELFAQRNITNNSFLYKIFQVINTAFVLYITGCFLVWVSKKRLQFSFSVVQSFYLISFQLSVVVFTILVILSLQVAKEEILPGIFWTYVEEARYYGLIAVLFHLALFVFFKHSLTKVSFLPKICFFAFAFFLAIETSRGFYLTIQRIKNFRHEEYSWQYENRFQKSVDTVIKKANSLYPSIPVIVAGSSYYYNHRISLYSHVPILYDFDSIIHHPLPKTTKTVIVVSVVDKKYAALIIKDRLGDLQGEFENFLIYTRYVPAN